MNNETRVDYQTAPERYKHWALKFEGPVATLTADFDENAGLRQAPQTSAPSVYSDQGQFDSQHGSHYSYHLLK